MLDAAMTACEQLFVLQSEALEVAVSGCAARVGGAGEEGVRKLTELLVASHAKKGRPFRGRPFLVRAVGQRPLPTVEVTWPVEARCWMSCTHWW